MSRRLTPFLAVSALLHGALLVLLEGNAVPPSGFGGETVTVLSVNFTSVTRETGARPQGRFAPHARPSRSAPAATYETPVLTADRPARPIGAGQAPPAPAGTAAAAAPEAGAAAESERHAAVEQARAHIEARLRARLERYFEYPYTARLRGWQGEVRLGFLVLPDGRLERLRVTRSSGFAVLDASALDSLGRVGRLDEAERWLHGRPLDMQISVVYRLRDGT